MNSAEDLSTARNTQRLAFQGCLHGVSIVKQFMTSNRSFYDGQVRGHTSSEHVRLLHKLYRTNTLKTLSIISSSVPAFLQRSNHLFLMLSDVPTSMGGTRTHNFRMTTTCVAELAIIINQSASSTYNKQQLCMTKLQPARLLMPLIRGGRGGRMALQPSVS